MRRGSLCVFAALVLALPSARANEDPILLTLNEVKTHYRNHRIGEAYTALKRLSELAAAPQFEAVRERLLPALSFYTGAIKFEMRRSLGHCHCDVIPTPDAGRHRRRRAGRGAAAGAAAGGTNHDQQAQRM